MKQLLVCVLAALSIAGSSVSTAAEPEKRLIEQLQSSDLRVQHSAVRETLSLATRSLPLNVALVKALKRANTDKDSAGPARKLPEDFDEYYLDLIESVAKWRDTKAAEALARSVARSPTARSALATFGEPGLVHLLPIAKSATEPTENVYASLETLVLMLSAKSDNPVCRQNLGNLRDLATERLTDNQAPIVLAAAVRLAVLVGNATGDEELISRVKKIASNPSVLKKNGISDPADVNMVVGVAKRALQTIVTTSQGKGCNDVVRRSGPVVQISMIG